MGNVKHRETPSSRQELVEELVLDLRRFAIGLQVANLEVAEAVGLNPSDLGCLCLLLLHGPSPAGRLAELTGLTTGAITGVIDRLERAGFAQRALDPSDRRKVIVKPDEEKVEQELIPHFAQLNRATKPSFYKACSEDELGAIGDFLSRLAGP
jgi:DNA-binding MarR family transcriptional regulator